jgi:hypothetical protein
LHIYPQRQHHFRLIQNNLASPSLTIAASIYKPKEWEREREREKVEIKAAKFQNLSPHHVPQKGFTSRCLTLS